MAFTHLVGFLCFFLHSAFYNAHLQILSVLQLPNISLSICNQAMRQHRGPAFCASFSAFDTTSYKGRYGEAAQPFSASVRQASSASCFFSNLK